MTGDDVGSGDGRRRTRRKRTGRRGGQGDATAKPLGDDPRTRDAAATDRASLDVSYALPAGLPDLFSQMGSPDKDIRYMATNDLMSELRKESFGVDDGTERRVVAQMLRMLEDKNGEVQNLVVKWYDVVTPPGGAKRGGSVPPGNGPNRGVV